MVQDDREIAPTAVPLMNVARSRVGTAVVLRVTGALDILTAASVANVVASAVEDALHERGVEALIIDVSRMGFFGSAGLAVLAEAASTTARRGLLLRLVVDQHRTVVETLQASGLDRQLVVFRTLDDALGADGDTSGDALT